jgi:hypothetical protein
MQFEEELNGNSSLKFGLRIVGEFVFSASWNTTFFGIVIKHFAWCSNYIFRLFNMICCFEHSDDHS